MAPNITRVTKFNMIEDKLLQNPVEIPLNLNFNNSSFADVCCIHAVTVSANVYTWFL